MQACWPRALTIVYPRVLAYPLSQVNAALVHHKTNHSKLYWSPAGGLSSNSQYYDHNMHTINVHHSSWCIYLYHSYCLSEAWIIVHLKDTKFLCLWSRKGFTIVHYVVERVQIISGTQKLWIKHSMFLSQNTCTITLGCTKINLLVWWAYSLVCVCMGVWGSGKPNSIFCPLKKDIKK